jgi:hypothetical protein
MFGRRCGGLLELSIVVRPMVRRWLSLVEHLCRHSARQMRQDLL